MPPRKGELPKKSYHWGETLPDALIDEAMRRVEPLGHHSLSTREVARAVGVSHAAPKHYFSDKLALVAAVAAAGFERLYQEIVRALERERDHPADQLVAAGMAYVGFALENRGLYRTMFASELSDAVEAPPRSTSEGADHFENLLRLKAKVFSLFVEIVREGQARKELRAGRPDDLARGVTAIANGLSHEFIDEGLGSRIDRAAHARQVFGVLLTGLEIQQDNRRTAGKPAHY
jgi:AcrR family transcriptional regulator